MNIVTSNCNPALKVTMLQKFYHNSPQIKRERWRKQLKRESLATFISCYANYNLSGFLELKIISLNEIEDRETV